MLNLLEANLFYPKTSILMFETLWTSFLYPYTPNYNSMYNIGLYINESSIRVKWKIRIYPLFFTLVSWLETFSVCLYVRFSHYFCDFHRMKGPRPKWTTYKRKTHKNKRCLSYLTWFICRSNKKIESSNLSFVDPLETEKLFFKFLYCLLQKVYYHKMCRTTHSVILLKFVMKIL